MIDLYMHTIYSDGDKTIEEILKMCEKRKLEYISPSANEEEMRLLVDYARNNDLYMSGGSDYHGKRKPDIEIGVGKGNLNISKKLVEEWL